MRKTIYQYLLKIGLSPKYVGFRYALDAINIYLNKDYIVQFNEDIYLKIAKKYQVGNSSVIKGIRNALDAAILRRHIGDDFLAQLQSERSGSIRVSAFIANAANIVRYEQSV